MVLNESGLIPVDAYVYLADEDDGTILELEDFFMPEDYAEYVGEGPDYQIREAMVCLDDMYEKQAGIAYATDQIIDLICNGVKGIHLYTMNKPEVASAIMNNISSIVKASQ